MLVLARVELYWCNCRALLVESAREFAVLAVTAAAAIAAALAAEAVGNDECYECCNGSWNGFVLDRGLFKINQFFLLHGAFNFSEGHVE